jgi:DMSO/TMAO reductase YedYZ molybdopterin-dependent catalytic subunit
MGLFSKRPPPDGVNVYGKPSLPPGQTGTEKFPVLTYGPVPEIDMSAWRLKVWGMVEAQE